MIDDPETVSLRYYPKAVRVKVSPHPECEGFWPFDSVEQRIIYTEGRLLPFAFESWCWDECARLEEAARSKPKGG